MKLKHPVGLILSGLLLCLYGAQMWHRYGVLPYLNWHNMPVFPIGVVITALLVAGLGLLPSGDWVYRLFRSQLHREPRVLRNKNPYRH